MKVCIQIQNVLKELKTSVQNEQKSDKRTKKGQIDQISRQRTKLH